MKETLVRDPKGLNRREDSPIEEIDKVCPVANYGRRPLGSGRLVRLRDGMSLSVLGRGK